MKQSAAADHSAYGNVRDMRSMGSRTLAWTCWSLQSLRVVFAVVGIGGCRGNGPGSVGVRCEIRRGIGLGWELVWYQTCCFG